MCKFEYFCCFFIVFAFVEVICEQEKGLCDTKIIFIQKELNVTQIEFKERTVNNTSCNNWNSSCQSKMLVPIITRNIKPYNVTKLEKKCCDGYELNISQDNCLPICNISCQNGVCYKPNECMCDNGYTINQTNAFECLPYCEKPCTNGYCSSPHNCSCYEGYEKDERGICFVASNETVSDPAQRSHDSYIIYIIYAVGGVLIIGIILVIFKYIKPKLCPHTSNSASNNNDGRLYLASNATVRFENIDVVEDRRSKEQKEGNRLSPNKL